jgi:branched-chain amino acid transport system permease protein
MSLDYLTNAAVNVSSGIAILVLVTIGLAITFGIMNVINLAHGEFVMIGAFTVVLTNHQGVPVWIGMLLAPVLTGALGVVVELILVRRLYGRQMEGTLLATFGLSLILQQVMVLSYGSSPEGIGTPFGSFQVGSYSITRYSLVLIGAAILTVGGVLLIFTRTRYGLKARATMQNREMAANLGIDTARINTATFALGAALAGVAGALIAPVVAVVPTMGVPLISSSFMTVVLGGPAVVSGTVGAAGLLGAIREVTAILTTPVIGTAALLVAAMVLLRILPSGLSASSGRRL